MREINKIRLAISYYCELRCRHCYVPAQLREHYDDIMTQQMDIETIQSYIKKLKEEYNLQKVDITGGEALLTKVWPRTEKVVSYCLENGLEVQVNTTGSGNIPAKQIRELIGEYRDLFLLHVSLDGIDEKYVDAFRGSKGAMSRSVAFMKSALEEGIRVRTRYTVTDENIDVTQDCYRFVTDLGVEAFMCKPVNIAGNSIKNHLKVLTPDQVREMQLKLLQQSVGCTTRLDLPSPLYVDDSEVPEGANAVLSQCPCGKHLVYVAYNGDIFPCTYLAGAPNAQDYIIGNIKDPNFDFDGIWNNPETYAEFRDAKRHVCTANRILSEMAVCS